MTASPAAWGEYALKSLFGSATRAEVLTALFRAPQEEIHARALATRLGTPYTGVLRELRRLSALGLLETRAVGRVTLYRLRVQQPLVRALGQVVDYAVGVLPRLREALEGPQVRAAFIFGSLATGSDGAASDVDLFVIGSIPPAELGRVARRVSRETGREINAISYLPHEFAAASREPSSFLQGVLGGPKLFLIGGEDVLRKLTAQRPSEGAAPAAGGTREAQL